MQQLKKLFFLLPFFWLLVMLWQMAGCKKEHSCEGCLLPASPHDTVVAPSVPVAAVLPNCALCVVTDKSLVSTWSFTIGDAYVCGNISDCGFIGEHNAFTFFGPSACSEDTGLVMTVYLPVALDKEVTSAVTNNTAFFYYDNQATQDILIKEPDGTPFSTTVQNYDPATGLTTGIFSGDVSKPDGSKVLVKNGKFKVVLR